MLLKNINLGDEEEKKKEESKNKKGKKKGKDKTMKGKEKDEAKDGLKTEDKTVPQLEHFVAAHNFDTLIGITPQGI